MMGHPTETDSNTDTNDLFFVNHLVIARNHANLSVIPPVLMLIYGLKPPPTCTGMSCPEMFFPRQGLCHRWHRFPPADPVDLPPGSILLLPGGSCCSWLLLLLGHNFGFLGCDSPGSSQSTVVIISVIQ